MKRNFLLLLLAAAMVSLTGCRGRDGRDGIDGIDGVITHRYVIDLEADNSNWVANNGAYYASFDIPELTKDAYDNGIVNVYAEFNTGTQNAYQEQLPFTYFDQSVNEETGDVFNWSRLLDFDYTVGSLTIYYTNNDFNYMAEEPGKWHFRLVLIW